MVNNNMLRRNYIIIKRIMNNDCPSKARLLESLKNYDIDIDGRTLERDINAIRYNLGVEIKYNRDKNGYFIDAENSDDFDKWLYFIGLAESADIILDSLKNKHELRQYLSISPSVSFKGVENVSVLLQAIRNRLVIKFNYLRYNTDKHSQYTVEPYLLKEFEGRWYLSAFVADRQAFRTFGLDRMSELETTDKQFQHTEKKEKNADRFNDVYGLIYMPRQENPPLETVRFRCNSDLLTKQLSALPLHHSQTITNDVVLVRVILNTELENKLLSFGELIEILSPETLRNTIIKRLTKTLNQYANK